MQIVVPIKQVPETSNVSMDPETGTMIRSGVESVVNPLDLYAIETALQLVESYGGGVTAISMGPPPAQKALREAIAMGCDTGVLLSDRRFGGADTWSTSYVLAKGIEALGSFDLVVAGERATDGDTAQVGPGIAAWLDIPVVTYVARIDGIETGTIVAERLVEDGYQIVEVDTPALLTVVKEIGVPRLPTLHGKRRARTAEIAVYTRESLDLDSAYLGLKGSPTKVVAIDTPKVMRRGVVMEADDEAAATVAVDRLVAFLDEEGLLSDGASR